MLNVSVSCCLLMSREQILIFQVLQTSWVPVSIEEKQTMCEDDDTEGPTWSTSRGDGGCCLFFDIQNTSQMIQRCNFLSWDVFFSIYACVKGDLGLLLIKLVQFLEIRHLIWVFMAAKRIHRVFLFRTLMPPTSSNYHKSRRKKRWIKLFLKK